MAERNTTETLRIGDDRYTLRLRSAGDMAREHWQVLSGTTMLGTVRLTFDCQYEALSFGRRVAKSQTLNGAIGALVARRQ